LFVFEYEVPETADDGAAEVNKRRIVNVCKSTMSAESWDDFAKVCDASFRCSYAGTHLWQFEHDVFSKVERLELFLQVGPGQVKIGQCAVGIGRKRIVFSDTIQLLPEFEECWSDCMRAVLDHLGPGLYQYGSEWTIAPCRAQAAASLAGIVELRSRLVDVQAIDFSRWDDFETYYKSVSTNARRNVKKAEKAYDKLGFREQTGRAVFRGLLPLQILRHRLFARKGVRSSLAALLVRSTIRTLATFRYNVLVGLTHGPHTLARYLGINFGRNYFYMEAAAEPEHPYAASYLLHEMISRSYTESNGRGHFVMGPDDHQQRGTPAWDGLVRSRQQWNVSAFPTSVLTFHYGV
jgi:hypothetical protein